MGKKVSILCDIYTFFLTLRNFLHYRVYVRIYEAHLEQYVIAFSQWRYTRKLRRKDVVNIVFFPMNVAMWKYQGLYDLLKKDERFRLFVFLAPATTFSYDARCKDLQDMRSYFIEHEVPFIDYELEKGKDPIDVFSIVEPDLVFHAQPYEDSVDECYNFMIFQNKLLGHIPYAFHARTAKFYNFNLKYNNIAWKLYYPNEENKTFARQYANNKGRNVVVVGNPNADDYSKPLTQDPWRIKNKTIKRVIWAPHFTIVKGVGFSQMSNFLNMAEFMRQLATDYSDRVTFAFKPHPRLYSELVKHPEWGEVKTKDYYDFWANSPTTQLETGGFVDLFKGSDAMIHDSGSFTVDYLYFGKPVLYDNPDIEAAKDTANETGKAAYDVHYKVTCNEDIRTFIDDVVIAGNDTMKTEREEYYNKYLRPPGGKSVAQNIYDDLIKSLGI